MIRRAFKAFALVLAGAAMAGLVFPFLQGLAAPLRVKPDPAAQVNPMDKDRYNGYGLADGKALSTEKIAEFEGVAIYSDRLVKRFEYDGANYFHIADMLKALKQADERIEHVYLMPVPQRVLIEKDYAADARLYGQYIERLTGVLEGVATVLDPWPCLSGHADEYIFYRTEDCWSARGAYYGSTVLCDALGIEPLPLEAYEEHAYKTFKGDLYSDFKDQCREAFGKQNVRVLTMDDMETDCCFMYWHPDGKNLERYVKEKGGSEALGPTISIARVGKGMFIGSSYSWAVLLGDSMSETVGDEALLMICDGAGQIVAPYMANYYENVYVASMSWSTDLAQELPRIVEEYGIRDVVVAQQADEVGNQEKSRALKRLLEAK